MVGSIKDFSVVAAEASRIERMRRGRKLLGGRNFWRPPVVEQAGCPSNYYTAWSGQCSVGAGKSSTGLICRVNMMGSRSANLSISSHT